jgi:16S rRNA U516 pseudouridylate synthase RsuA-like enzyme
MENDTLLLSSSGNDRDPKKTGRHLRLDKDPNLTLDFFWDLRRDCIPLFRALQLTKFITSSSIPISTKDEDDEKIPVASSTNIAVDRVPSKFEVKNWLKDHPQSLRINVDGDAKCNITYQQLVSATEQDNIYISRSAAAALLCSSLEKNDDREKQKAGLDQPSPRPLLHPRWTYDSDDSWFRLGPRVAPQFALVYKRRGIICTCKRGPHEANVPTIGDVLDEIQKANHQPVIIDPLLRPLVHVGRLDLESEGLLLLTNDGTFSRLCTSPAVGLKKIYRVFVKSKGRRRWTNDSHGVDDEGHSSLTILEEFQQRLYEITDKVERQLLQKKLALPGTGATSSVVEVGTHKDPKPACSESEFRAKSCTIVDFRVDNSCAAHMAHKSSHTDACEADNVSTVPAVLAVLDIEMREGAKREVRRLMRSIDFVTLMLARTTIGELEWQSLSTTGATNWDFCVPKTIQEAQEKCLTYHTQSSHHDFDVLERKRQIMDCSEAFRFLEKGEVDRIFSNVDIGAFFGSER